MPPWQAFVVGSLFGWKRRDGLRRFRTAYAPLPEKRQVDAGRRPRLLLASDGEAGAEVYAAATKRDQAKIVWGEAKGDGPRSTAIKRRVNVLTGNLHSRETAQVRAPGADAGLTDGLNIHAAVVDELHAHKTRSMWDVIETATGARRQPLTFAITTAGFERTSVCFEQDDYGTQVLEGIIEDDSFFAFIARIDPEDDWTDPACWPKANPNLSVSVKPDDLERKCEKAKLIPGEQNAFFRLHLNVWAAAGHALAQPRGLGGWKPGSRSPCPTHKRPATPASTFFDHDSRRSSSLPRRSGRSTECGSYFCCRKTT